MAYPRFRLARAHKSLTRTSGLLYTGNAWNDLVSDGSFDIVLPARVGDTIEAFIGTYYQSADNSTGCLNVVTMVAGAAVGSFGPNGASDYGVANWMGALGARSVAGGSAFHTLTGGEISGGKVTLRLQGRNDNGVSRALSGTAAMPFLFGAKNIGPAAP